MDGLKEFLREKVLEEIDLHRETSEEEIYERIDRTLLRYSKEEYISIPYKQKLKRDIFNSIRKLDVLQDLIDDPEITEIMVNGPKNIFIEKQGAIYSSDKTFETQQKLEDVIQQIVSHCNRIINESSPIVDARLSDGSRVNIVLAPISMEGPTLTIRKFPNKPITMERLIELGAISLEVADYLKTLVIAGYNILISGGTGSGKTTFLNVLSNYIPSTERIITIEDSAELQIRNIPNLVRMEVRNANSEGSNEITIRELIKTSLRMRPSRIIVGEVRNEAAIDMLQAMNTGHDGSLTTAHANSSNEMLSRLETLVLLGSDIPLLAVRKQIASAIDIIVHLGRLRDRSRRVLEVAEVMDCKEGEIPLNILYQFEEKGEADGKIKGKLLKVNELKNTEKLLRAGCSI